MSMNKIRIRCISLTIASYCGVLFGQYLFAHNLFAQTKAGVAGVQEFPVTMRQNVVAGQTPVGTKVEARLEIATLVSGNVLPIGATFSGEVVESVPKSASSPSRLSIRMDSVQWKKGSASIKTYLTAWYYPLEMELHHDHYGDRNGIHGDIGMQRGGPPPDMSSSQPFPGRPNGPDYPPNPSSRISDHRVAMKDVESEKQNDGGIAITSSHLNIKLDKTTTYVLATGDLTPPK